MVFCPTKTTNDSRKISQLDKLPPNLLKQMAHIQKQPYELDKKSIAQIFLFSVHKDLSYFY
jgi:hypothetical protein